MKGNYFLGSRQFQVREMSFPPLGDFEVKIQNMAAGICGTDIHIYHGEKGSAEVTPPVVLGHEYAGVVVETGRGVTTVRTGDHVTVDPNIYCGTCSYCKAGKKQLCSNLVAVGVNFDGGFAQYSVVPEGQVYRLNPEVSFAEGAMAEPLACCIHGVELAGIELGDTVCVIGGGNVAIDCARNAHRLGASEVSMFCLESRDEMPASREEVAEAEEENIKVNPSWGPKEVLVDESGKVTGIVLKKCVRTIDPETKRFSPVYDENETIEVKADKIVFAIGQAIEWGNLLEGTKVTFWHGNYPVADKFTYQTEDPDIFVGGDVYTGPRFVIDAIAAGHEAAESLHRHARPDASMTIGRDRRSFTPLNKDDIKFPSYDTAGRQEAGMDESIDAKMSFKDAHLDLTEEQVKIETGRCLGCGASYVDYNKCIGCGLCTTKCEFDAIHLVRDHPECSTMCVAEDKVGGLLKYSVKRAFKILGHLGSDEAKEMAKKRKAYKQAQQNKD